MKNNPIYLFIILVLILGCSKDDSPYVDAENTINLPQLFYGKTWAIYEVEGNGNRVDVPEEGECGRDYFRYLENGEYVEFSYPSSSCIPEINRLNFTLNGSVITLTNGTGEEAEVRILKLDNTNFNFETSLDIDGDQKDDKVILYSRIYSPEDRDIYSETFTKDFFKFQDDNLIAFNWAEYVGDEFKQYEIYRASNSCNKNDAIKIATIKDLAETEFIDLDPEPADELCYFFRLQTNSGQLAESDIISIQTSDIDVYKTEMLSPEVTNETVQLNWQKYDSPYFQKYEITVSKRAYHDNSPEEIVLTTIEDQETTSFTIETPPSVEDPFYNIHVYNIFGKRSTLNLGESFTDNSVEVKFSPDEVVDMMSVYLLGVDPSDGNNIYLWGEGSSDSYKKIKKINVQTKEVIAESSFDLNTSSEVRLKVVQSTDGKEVLIQVGSEYHVFDAISLEYKYRLRDLNDEYISFEDLQHFKEDIWIIADGGDELRTVRRFGRDLQTIDVVDPEPTTIFKRMNDLVRIGETRILAGIIGDDRSFSFDINEDGTIDTFKEVDYSFNNRLESTEYNAFGNILLDKINSRIYAADTYSFISSYSIPVHTSSLSQDGDFVLGTNYQGDTSLEFIDLFDRQLNILNWRTGQTTTINTIGYPQYTYETKDGKLVLISSYFKRYSLYRGEEKNDLFIEVIDWR
nr:lipocalin family protein [uncultured Allomuricauda sp.]